MRRLTYRDAHCCGLGPGFTLLVTEGDAAGSCALSSSTAECGIPFSVMAPDGITGLQPSTSAQAADVHRTLAAGAM